MSDYADLSQVVAGSMSAWRPPPKLTLSEWADQNFYLSAESAAEPGRWKTLPYQVGIMDAITDPAVEQVSVMKSARVGYTKCMNAAIGYYMHQAPCPILVVQPTVDDAKGYSKEEVAPMIRDCPVLTAIVHDDPEAENGPKDSGNTILHKKFPGGVLSMVGANSGAGFRRVSRKVVIFDEVDGYPPTAGSDGDQIKLGIKRSDYYHDRKIIAGSTPLVAGHSRIETLFASGDQRRYYVPCPHCGHKAPLVFREKDGQPGHAMKWPEDRPQDAFFSCEANGCVIEHKDKRAIVTAGEWRATAPFVKHASFHIWAAYSFSPNATWSQLAEEFIAAKSNPETLKTFVNTVLGETWVERGEAPEWERLYQRRETYAVGSVPAGVQFLTCGVDVQRDRWVYEVVGWGENKQSWSIDAGVIPGRPENAEAWKAVDELLSRKFPTYAGTEIGVRFLAVDSGDNTQMVYNWARRHVGRVLAVKGQATARTLIGSPTVVDIKVNGQRFARGCKVWPIGVSIAKSELYGWLKLPAPLDEGDSFPNGFCHFPEHGPDYFKQLTGEQLVSVVNKRTGFAVHEWQLLPGRENHWLDCRVYARAAAAQAGLDRMQPKFTTPTEAAPTVFATPGAAPTQPQAQPAPQRQNRPDSRFLAGRGSKGWLSKKR